MIRRLTPARPRDVAALAGLLASWKRETPWAPDPHDPAGDRATLRRLIRRGDVTALRGLYRALGFMARDGEEIHALYLHPRLRGRGYGRRLLDHAKARSDRLALWAFQANFDARRFYAREGFCEVGLSDGAGNDEGLPDVRLIWTRNGAGR